jgi:hypothetical protein
MKREYWIRFFVITTLILCFFQVQAQGVFKKEEAKFVYLSSLGFAKGVNDIHFDGRTVKNNIPVISIHQVLAYQFNPYVILGVGAGYDLYSKTGFIPLYTHLTAGYSFKWYVNQKPEPMTRVIHAARTGLYGETGLGLKMKMSPKFALLFSVNYKLQQSHIYYSVIDESQPDISQLATNSSAFALYHFLGFKLGFLF